MWSERNLETSGFCTHKIHRIRIGVLFGGAQITACIKGTQHHIVWDRTLQKKSHNSDREKDLPSSTWPILLAPKLVVFEGLGFLYVFVICQAAGLEPHLSEALQHRHGQWPATALFGTWRRLGTSGTKVCDNREIESTMKHLKTTAYQNVIACYS